MMILNFQYLEKGMNKELQEVKIKEEEELPQEISKVRCSKFPCQKQRIEMR